MPRIESEAVGIFPPKTMLALTLHHVHVWLAFVDDITDEHLLNRYRRMMSNYERHQEQRFHFAADRHRYLVTRAMTRTLLSQYVPLAPDKWLFSSNEYGKPEIINEDDNARRISFNISHTKGLIALAITLDRPLGIDTENLRARNAPIEVATQFFTPLEVDALHRLPPHLRQECFFQYWTLKESYVKARGVGLTIPLNEFGFQIADSDRIGISMAPQLEDHPSRWRFWLIKPTEDHVAAVCVRRSEVVEQQLTVRKFIPLVSEESLAEALA